MSTYFSIRQSLRYWIFDIPNGGINCCDPPEGVPEWRNTTSSTFLIGYWRRRD